MIEDKKDQIDSTEFDFVSQIEEIKARIWLQPYCPQCRSLNI